MEALILEVATRGLHRYYPIDGEVTTVGRALDNDIILSDPTVAPHHVRITRRADGGIEIDNLTAVNPTRIGRQKIDRKSFDAPPVSLEIGRVRAQLLTRSHAVSATRPIAGDERASHLFGHASWAVALVIACLLAGALEFYFNAYNSFKWTDPIKYVLRETVFTLGALILALAVLERLLVNRWEIKQLVISVCLVYLLFHGLGLLADGLGYLLSSSWPVLLFDLGWNLLLVPFAIALYLVHISHLRTRRSVLLALLIAGPLAVPSLLRNPQLVALLDDFSNAAPYHNSLSALNWHLGPTLSIEEFAAQAQSLRPGRFAD